MAGLVGSRPDPVFDAPLIVVVAMIHANNLLLIQAIEATPLLDGRFQGMRVVNCDLATGRKRGCFSVVFRAEDVIDNKPVALKFYDLSPASLGDAYRLAGFRRESQILASLLNLNRCLQLVADMRPYMLPISVPGVGEVALPCQYFVVEWLEHEIDQFFLAQQTFDAALKLRLFNEIVLGIEALHCRDVFHRDLKADNLRARGDQSGTIVAIDLGTAARTDSAVVKTDYADPVGIIGYAPPEALCGLAGVRRIAALSDVYALGCLLFELFEPDKFCYAVRNSNAQFDARLLAMAQYVTGPDDDAKVEQWHSALAVLGRGVTPVRFDAASSSLPLAIAPQINEVLARLTDVDYRKRKNQLPWARQAIWSSIKVLSHEIEYQRRLAELRKQRKARAARAEQKRERRGRLLGAVS